jgi:hypothetical protein
MYYKQSMPTHHSFTINFSVQIQFSVPNRNPEEHTRLLSISVYAEAREATRACLLFFSEVSVSERGCFGSRIVDRAAR